MMKTHLTTFNLALPYLGTLSQKGDWGWETMKRKLVFQDGQVGQIVFGWNGMTNPNP